jgi:hypothetical protein
MTSLSTLLTLSLALILFAPPLSAEQSWVCHVAPCGHVENQCRIENLFAAYGATPEETKPFEPPSSICNGQYPHPRIALHHDGSLILVRLVVWNDNKFGGPNPNRAFRPCLGYTVGPTGQYTSVGGIKDGIDIDL